MKNIFKLSILLSSLLLLFSCQKKDADLATAVAVDKAEAVFEALNPAAVTLSVAADGDWIVRTPSWLTATPAYGSGEAEIVLTAAENVNEYGDVIGPRKDKVFIYADGAQAVVTVSQKGENGLNTERTYTKVTDLADLETGRNYLIVVKNGDKLQAAIAFAASSESTYSYIFTTEVEEAEAGKIVYKDNSLGWFLADGDAAGQAKVCMPTGRYLFQSASYNNFYSTTDVTKADNWTAALNEDGTFTLTNIAVGKWLQFSTGYGNFGAYNSAQTGALLPMLYKDSSTSTETINVPEKILIPASATSAVINVTTTGNTWKARCYDDWVTYEVSGGKITLGFLPNTTGAARTATLTVIGETTCATVELTQGVPFTTFAQVKSSILDGALLYDVEVDGAVVSYVNGGTAYLEDGTAGLMLYQSGHGLHAGDVLTGAISGKATLYNGLPELTSLDKSRLFVNAGGEIPLVEVTVADLLKDYDKYLCRRVKLTGVAVTDAVVGTDRSGKVSQDGKTIDVYAKVNNKMQMEERTEGNLICFPEVNNGTKRLGVWEKNDWTQTKAAGVIAFDAAAVTVKPGATLSCVGTANSGAAVTYSSSNEAIFTVDAEGLITAVAEGEAVLNATCPATDEYTAGVGSVAVTVSRFVLATKVIDATNCPTSYPTTEATFTSDGVEMVTLQVAKHSSGAFMFNKKVNDVVSYLANNTALSKIQKVVIKKHSAQKFYSSNYALYVGNSVTPMTTTVAQTASSNTEVTWDLSALESPVSYISIVNTSTYVGYFGTLEITYIDGGDDDEGDGGNE